LHYLSRSAAETILNVAGSVRRDEAAALATTASTGSSGRLFDVARSPSTADRIERFLSAHAAGPLVVCVGSASVAGIAWLAERSSHRPVTLLIGDMKSRNFAKATDTDRSAALRFVQRSDVTVLNWYRTDRSKEGRSEAHLKVWAVCDAGGTPQSFLVGSANLTIAGLHENVELMALTDDSEHAYLRSTLQQLQDKSWDTRERLETLIEHDDVTQRRHRRSGQPSRQHDPAASKGCGAQILAAASLTAAGAALLVYCVHRSRSAV
jgi:hypothetical protein